MRKWQTFLTIEPSHHAYKWSIGSLIIGGCEFTASANVRNLGVYFDCQGLMKQQINTVVKSCNYQKLASGRIIQYPSFKAAANLIHAFTTSRLDYGNSLLSGLPDNEITKLQKVQNTTTCMLTQTKKYDHMSPVFLDLHWLSVKKRIDFSILILTSTQMSLCHHICLSYLRGTSQFTEIRLIVI